MWHTGDENGFHLLNLRFISALVPSSSPSFLNPYQMFFKVGEKKNESKRQDVTHGKLLNRKTGPSARDMKCVCGGD